MKEENEKPNGKRKGENIRKKGERILSDHKHILKRQLQRNDKGQEKDWHGGVNTQKPETVLIAST